MPISLGTEFLDFNQLLRQIKVRFFVVGSTRGRNDPNMALVYAFPASDYRLQINDNASYPAAMAQRAFQRTWAVENAPHPYIIFDACTLEAATEFASVNHWPVFVQVERLLGSSTFTFKQVPIQLVDLAGKPFALGHSDPARSASLHSLSSTFKHEILYAMIDALREDYLVEHAAEAHAGSIRLTHTWLEVNRLADELHGVSAANRRMESTYSSIQRLRNQTPKEHGLAPAVIVALPDHLQATLSAIKQGPAPFKNRAKIHFSFELTEAELSYHQIKRLVRVVQQTRIRDEHTAPVVKRRQIILEESKHGESDL